MIKRRVGKPCGVYCFDKTDKMLILEPNLTLNTHEDKFKVHFIAILS